MIIFAVSNAVGAYIHDCKLCALKTLFTDTYKCVIARLHMEDENEKLVSSLPVKVVFECVLLLYSSSVKSGERLAPISVVHVCSSSSVIHPVLQRLLFSLVQDCSP